MSDVIKNEAHPELVSLHSIFPFLMYDSASRLVMAGNHFGQRLIVKGVNEKRVQTGAEYELGKYTFSTQMPADGMIVKVIDRYPASVGKDSIPASPERLVIYQDNDTQEYGCFSIENFTTNHNYFGFKNKHTKEAQRIYPGTYFEKGVVFSDTPCKGENGEYNYGVDMKVALLSHPAGAEDGILISESARKKLTFNLYEKRIIEVGKDYYPLNLYGDENNFKPIPDIGEPIRDDGIVAILRKYDTKTLPVDISKAALMEPDYMFDTMVYARAGKNRVVDIKVYHDDEDTNVPEGMTEHLDKYSRSLKNYYEEIHSAYLEIKSKHKRQTGEPNPPIKPEFKRLLIEAKAVLAHQPQGEKVYRLNKLYRKYGLDDYRIEITIEYEVTPVEGMKFTDAHAGKQPV